MNINTVKVKGNGYLVNGNINVPNDDMNRDYLDIKLWLQENTPEPEFSSDDLLSQAMSNLVSMTDKHIQAEVEKYNEANNVLFGSIHNCSTYVTLDTYPHQAFCIAIIKWNADVWEAVRTYQASQTELGVLPTEEEFQAVLDSVVFNA